MYTKFTDLRTTLSYLGVIIIGSSYMFGDNGSVVLSSVSFTTKLDKSHNVLSFHQVRESIAAGICRFHYLPGELNPVDILSKHWSYSDVWQLLCPLMFWHGYTAEIPMDYRWSLMEVI